MTQQDSNDLDEVQRFLLMAAYYEGARPGSRFQKCVAVVFRAITMAGMWDDRIRRAYDIDEPDPHIEQFYGALIALIRWPPRNPFFLGRGNLGSETSPPAFMRYTECRLTARGARLAKDLLKEKPHLRPSDKGNP